MPGTGPMRKAETLPLPRFISAYLERHGVKIEQSDVPRVAWPSNSVCGATVEALSRSLSRLSIRRSYIAFQKICTRSQPFFYRQYTRCLLPVFLHLAHLLAGHGGPNDLRAFVSEFEKGFREPNEQKLIQEMLAQGEKFVVPDFKVRMDEIAMSYLMKQLREEGLDLLMYVFDSLIRADVGGLPSDGGVLAVEEVGERGGQGPEIAHITFYNHYGTVSDLKLAKSMNVLAVAQESGVTLDSLVERAVFPNDASACEVLRHRARVLRTCISPNSCLVCSTSVDGEIRFAHTEVCKEMCRFNLHLEPVFDLRYHAFCPEYFSSTQVLVNPLYVSRFLKVLQRTELSSMAIVLQAEMRRMERMLNEVLQMKHKALSELDLAMMRKRTPSKSQVMESSEYQDALAVLNKLKKRLDEEDECYANDAAALHTSIVETVHELRERVESFGTLNERFDMIRGKQRLATMQMKLMQYLRCIFSHSAMSLSTGLGQAFREWTQCVTKASEVLDRYLSTRDGRILESFLSELLAARNSIVSSSFFGHEKRNQNVQSLRLEHHDGRTTTHTVTDKRDNMASMVREAEQGNVERVGNSEALVDCSRKVLNCLSKIATHKPLSQRLSLLENSPAPDLDRRLERLSEINNMISNRKVLISKIQAEMEQIQKEVTSHDKSENSRKVCRKAPGIDATYTQIRMTLACEICDRQASVYVGGCGHMICEKCEQRARKSKATQCPVCGTICEFITIKY